jgi:hypothetical protein
VELFKWMNADFFSFEEAWKHFISFGALMKNKRYANVRHVIWLATTWCLWHTRNKIMFRGEVVNLQSCLDYLYFLVLVYRLNSKFIFCEFFILVQRFIILHL